MRILQARRIRSWDDGGTPQWRARHQNWYQRSRPLTVFFVMLFGVFGLLTLGPIIVLLLCWAFVP